MKNINSEQTVNNSCSCIFSSDLLGFGNRTLSKFLHMFSFYPALCGLGRIVTIIWECGICCSAEDQRGFVCLYSLFCFVCFFILIDLFLTEMQVFSGVMAKSYL